MTTAAIDWGSISKLSGGPSSELWRFTKASIDLQQGEVDEPTLLGVVPRLADLIETRPELEKWGAARSARWTEPFGLEISI